MKLKYGGELQIGDFLAISNGNYISFGWYCGTGRGTLQYFGMHNPQDVFNHFKLWQTNPDAAGNWYKKKFEKDGFTSKLLYKNYIYGDHVGPEGTRVMKIQNPESVFTEQRDIQKYRDSKEALIYIKFPAK